MMSAPRHNDEIGRREHWQVLPAEERHRRPGALPVGIPAEEAVVGVIQDTPPTKPALEGLEPETSWTVPPATSPPPKADASISFSSTRWTKSLVRSSPSVGGAPAMAKGLGLRLCRPQGCAAGRRFGMRNLIRVA
jgi:hypothetical protein